MATPILTGPHSAIISTNIIRYKSEFAKPDPWFFEEFLLREKYTAVKTLHVGTSLTNDVDAAQKAGQYAVWLHRSNRVNNTNIRTAAVISRLDALPSPLN